MCQASTACLSSLIYVFILLLLAGSTPRDVYRFYMRVLLAEDLGTGQEKVVPSLLCQTSLRIFDSSGRMVTVRRYTFTCSELIELAVDQ
jgi:hypothetical protein